MARTDRAMNPRSHVGDVAGRHASGMAEPDVLHPSEDSTIARGIYRGAWRRPHIHRSRAEVVGLVLWWLLVGAVASVTVIFMVGHR